MPACTVFENGGELAMEGREGTLVSGGEIGADSPDTTYKKHNVIGVV